MNEVEHNPQAAELVDTFELLDGWEDRYQFIIDLGKELEPLSEAEKTEANRVYGCQSTVHLVPEVTDGGEAIEFRAESDAAIVNGLIAILRRVYHGRTPEEILGFDIEGFLHQLGLDEHLSPTRRNGLFEMDKRIRGIARAAHEG
ncbi:MAG: SufE family protein [Phycisphaeraceae bacterium]